MKKDHRTYYTKIFKKDKEVSNRHTKSLKRFLSKLRLTQFKEGVSTNVSIKVTYGLKENHQGKREMFDNSGDYTNPHDLMLAAIAFTREK